ncbi:MAG TPA: glycosyltransferase family 2 protein [Pirellulales bacterium]|jgi:glycosyltransferase involved in cell wall biosynthesis|nr:glycosyltransferase family 2 protein [Pirellulales bacterium]
MKFSICIPNYNYERYLGRTIASVREQQDVDLEIVLSDNASTDGSVALAHSFADPRIQVRVNAVNVGFAGNLDRAARMATGEWLVMLSSDDLVRPDALATYRRMIEALGPAAETSVFTSAMDMISSDDRLIDHIGREESLWHGAERSAQLEQAAGAPVYVMPADELLRRCLRQMKNPFNFAATCYPHRLYQAVEGYGAGRLMNPDKYFHWKLLTVADRAYFVDRPLFAYRWHEQNQTALEAGWGALKFLVDEYASTLEMDEGVLTRLGVTRQTLSDALVEHDIARHGLATLARGNRVRAKRILHFGCAVYPDSVRHNRNARILSTLLRLGPVGQRIARWAYARHLDRQKQ